MSAYDLVIVGGGAAGSKAALSLAEPGRHRILLVEAEHFGGTCTNHGCVPTKALVKAEKAQIDGQTHGHVKVVADAVTGELLGCHMVAETAGDMIHETVAIMSGRVPVAVAARAMHAYPTRSELTRTALDQAAG